MALIKEYICSSNYIKEQNSLKPTGNKSEGDIDTNFIGFGFNNNSLDGNSFDLNRVEGEEECENVSEANIILKFEFLPENIGVVLDENISSDEIVQDSERTINAKGFNINFLDIFDSSLEEANAENKNAILNRSIDEVDKTVKQKVDTFVPTIIKLREGDHRNHVIKLSDQDRSLIKETLENLTTFFIKQKLSLLRFVRPMNSEIIKEALRCMSQINSKTMSIDLDLKEYSEPKEILLKMVKDEMKSSTVLRFGYQEIYPGEEVFFAISTKHFKNFDFENNENTGDVSRKNIHAMLNSKTNKFLQFAHK